MTISTNANENIAQLQSIVEVIHTQFQKLDRDIRTYFRLTPSEENILKDHQQLEATAPNPPRGKEHENPYTVSLNDTSIEDEDSISTPKEDDKLNRSQISTPSNTDDIMENTTNLHFSPIRQLDLTFEQSPISPSGTDTQSHTLLPSFSPIADDTNNTSEEDSYQIDKSKADAAMLESTSQYSNTESTIRSPIKKKPYNPSADLDSVQYDKPHAPDGGAPTEIHQKRTPTTQSPNHTSWYYRTANCIDTKLPRSNHHQNPAIDLTITYDTKRH